MSAFSIHHGALGRTVRECFPSEHHRGTLSCKTWLPAFFTGMWHLDQFLSVSIEASGGQEERLCRNLLHSEMTPGPLLYDGRVFFQGLDS